MRTGLTNNRNVLTATTHRSAATPMYLQYPKYVVGVECALHMAYKHLICKCKNLFAFAEFQFANLMVSFTNAYWNSFDFSVVKEMFFSDDEVERCTVTKGDILMCEGGAYFGRTAIWNYDYDICFQNHVHRLRPYQEIDLMFFYHSFDQSKELQLTQSVENLERLGLLIKNSNVIELNYDYEKFRNHWFYKALGLVFEAESKINMKKYRIELTQMGQAFVSCCFEKQNAESDSQKQRTT